MCTFVCLASFIQTNAFKIIPDIIVSVTSPFLLPSNIPLCVYPFSSDEHLGFWFMAFMYIHE